MNATNFLKVAILALPLMLASCGSKKKAVEETTKPVISSTQTQFLDKVTNNAQQARFITSKVKFSVQVGEQDISLTGNLKMKRDSVIRLQLMAFGFVEAARLEFTKDYVLIMDRINKQYLMAPYMQIDFLRNSGLNFYTLQALFWNELFQPNHSKLTAEDMHKFTMNTDTGNDDAIVSFETEKIDYSWLLQQSTAVINMTNILYKDRFNGNTQLNWDYEDYKLIESTNKLFPNTMNIALTTPKKEVKLEIKLNYIKHETGWEELTKVSNKYREVTIDEILQRFMAL